MLCLPGALLGPARLKHLSHGKFALSLKGVGGYQGHVEGHPGGHATLDELWCPHQSRPYPRVLMRS